MRNHNEGVVASIQLSSDSQYTIPIIIIAVSVVRVFINCLEVSRGQFRFSMKYMYNFGGLMSFGPFKQLAAVILLSLSVLSFADANHFRSIKQERTLPVTSGSDTSNVGLAAIGTNRVRLRQSETPPVYPGCREYTQNSLGKTLIVDESEPRSLQELFDDGTIQPGMTVKIRRQESAINLNIYKHEYLTHSESDWITIIGEENASIDSIKITSITNMRFTGLEIGNMESDEMIYTSDTENIIIDDNFIRAGNDFETWSAEQWQAIGKGVYLYKSQCSSVYNNTLKNLRFGISVYAYDEEGRQEYLTMKALLKDNFIQNISADFIRPLGSDITVDGNTGTDSYVSEDDGDPNHDDFVQGYAYPLGVEFQNVKIINNFYQVTTDLTRPWQSDGQGIAVFDGLYTNFEISNNTIISNMYHGITVFWGRDGIIKNNTSLLIDNSLKNQMWIQSTYDKSGKNAPVNVKVVNNVTSYLSLHENTEKLSHNNVVIDKELIADELIKYDPYNLIFDVAVKKDSPYYVDGTGSTITTLEAAMK